MTVRQMDPRHDEAGAAEFLNLKRQTMSNMRHQRRGPVYYKIGSRVLYLESDLKAYLAKHRIDPEARQ